MADLRHKRSNKNGRRKEVKNKGLKGGTMRCWKKEKKSERRE